MSKRRDAMVGNAFAEGWLEPCWQNGSVSAGRTCEVNQVRPSWSIMGLCELVWLSQIFSSP